MRILILASFMLLCGETFAQDLQVEYDKKRDLSKYKTFSMGEGEIITPKDRRVMADDVMHNLIKEAIEGELKDKGLERLDSLGDLTVSYVVGSTERMDLQNLGPMGETPGGGAASQTWSRDYQQTSFIIDLNDRGNMLIWRINAVTAAGPSNAGNMIKEVVSKGFKKFSLKPKKEKKKKD